MTDLTPIVNAVISLAVVLITTFLIPWIKRKTTTEQRSELAAWVNIGVAAAEQIYIGSGRGKEKKEYVLAFLAGKGYTVNEESINAMIEAAVQQLNSSMATP